MPALYFGGFPALLQFLASILADGLQHPVAHRTPSGRSGHHERLVDQSAQEIQDLVLFDGASRAHRLCCL